MAVLELIAKLQSNGLIDNMGNIILAKYGDGGCQTVDQQTFQNFFGSTDFSYTQLVTADQGKGYTQFFDYWKAEGIIT